MAHLPDSSVAHLPDASALMPHITLPREDAEPTLASIPAPTSEDYLRATIRRFETASATMTRAHLRLHGTGV